MFNRYTSLTQQPVNITRTFETPPLVNKLWTIVMDDRIYQTLSFAGTLMAIFVMCIWCVQTYKNLKEGGSRPKAKELILPLMLIVLLFNDGRNMKELTFGAKNTVHSFNPPLNKVVAEDVVRSEMTQAKPSTMTQATCNEPNRSQLSTSNMLDDPYIKRAIAQYQISF